MEHYDDSDLSLKPKNSQSVSERQTTAKKHKRRPHSERKAVNESQDKKEMSIIDYVDILVDKQENAQRKCKYKTAMSCKNKLSHLREHIAESRMKTLKESHKQQKQRIKQAHQQEMARVDASWMKMFGSYDRKVQIMIEKWEMKKDKDLRNLDMKIERLNQNGFKLRSNTLRQLKKARKYYLKSDDYQQVKLIDREIDEITEDLHRKTENQLKEKFIKMHEDLNAFHNKQEAVLEQRIKRSKEEQMIQCHSQKKKIMKKYNNVISKLEAQQTMQKRELESINQLPMGNSLRESRRIAEWIKQKGGYQ